MTNSDAWLNYIVPKLSANRFRSMKAEEYQPQGFKYAAQLARFEITKFGMAEYFFTFAEIPNLTPPVMLQYSGAAYNFAVANKEVSLPNGLFSASFCFAVAMTENLAPETAELFRNTEPTKHWGSFEMPVIFDLKANNLVYYEKTPLWGAAYFAGFLRMVEANLR